MTSIAEPLDKTQSAPARLSLSIRAVGWTLPAAVAALVVAVLLRFWDLDHRALHHDESLHAYFSWRFAEFFEYDHNPLMHGPFQFHAIATVFSLFGDSDYTARVAAATFGSALVMMPFFLREYLGRAGWLATAVFIALSPTLLYFSRFAREDMFVAVWTLAMVIFIWRYLAAPKPIYLAGLAAALALSFATKETTFITALIFIAFLNGLVALDLWRTWRDKPVQRPQRWLTLAGLLAGAWALVSTWPLLRGFKERHGLFELPVAAAPLLVIGLLTAPQFAAAIQVPLEAAGVNLARQWTTFHGHAMTTEIYVGIAAVTTLLVATFAVGLAWNWRLWLLAVAAFYLPYIVLFTTLGSEQDGFASGIWGSLDYWLAQQDVQRGDQPWFYYLMTVPIYEFLPLTFALIGTVFVVRRGDAFDYFLGFWFVAMFVALSLAGEKMPWLTVHLALPLTLIAGRAVERLVTGALLPNLPDRRTLYWGPAAALLGAILVVFSTRTAVVGSFVHGDEPYELLVYVQSTQELVDVSELVNDEAQRSGLGRELPIVVDSSDGFSWPWAWYLRDYNRDGYVAFDGEYQPPTNSVLLVNSRNVASVDEAAFEQRVTYQHRAWFPEAYKSFSIGEFISSTFEGGSVRRWWDFLANRDFEQDLGHIDGVAFFPESYATDE
jgi:uncharacterized protein (TIGR03663 family)